MDSMAAKGLDPSAMGADPKLLQLLSVPEEHLSREQRQRVQAYKQARDGEEAGRSAMQQKLKEFEMELESSMMPGSPMMPGIATGGLHVATMRDMVSGVDDVLASAERSFRSLDEVRDQARREIQAAQMVASEASGAVEDAQHELDVTTYWLGAVQDKVDREVRQARKAASRLKKVKKKQKGGKSDKAPAWLSRPFGSGSISPGPASPEGPLSSPDMEVGVNPLTQLWSNADAVEPFRETEMVPPAPPLPGMGDSLGPPRVARDAWTPEEKERPSSGAFFPDK